MHPTSNRRQSANLSFSSACRTSGAFSDSPTKQKPEEGKEDNTEISFGRLPNQTDITFVEPMASESSFRAVLSSKRQKAVAALPPVLFNVNNRHLNNAFDREFLKITLGKTLSDRSVLPFVIPRLLHPDSGLSIKLESSRKQTVASYLCPTLKHHPWCPSRIGDHGFIFVGLGKDKDSYKSAAIRNLFVGLPKTVMDRRFRYLGRYQVTRVDPLSVDEWAMLSAEVSAASDLYKNL